MEENKTIVEKKTTKCLNCDTEFEGNFCPECGQRADTGRFTIKFIFENLLKAIISNDGGVWITLKTLFTHPGQMMVDIIKGKRKSYFSPFPMLFLTLSLYILIYSFTGSRKIDLEDLYDDEKTEVRVNDEKYANELTESRIIAVKITNYFAKAVNIYSNNYTAVFILTIPIYILAARVGFGKKNRKTYNWGEFCIPIVYSLILIVLYQCLSSIVYYFSTGISDKMDTLRNLLIVIVFTACFKNMMGFSLVKTAWRSIITVLFYWMLVGIAVCLAALTAGIVVFTTHPEYFR